MRVGIDIEKISRMNLRLLNKIANNEEKEYCKNSKANLKQRIASVWTAKEAAMKMLGGKGLTFRDFVLHHDPETQQPKLELLKNAEKIAEKYNIKEINVSISHTKTDCVAIIIGGSKNN